MADIYKILNTHWGFKEFRPLQEKVITAVMGGQDTLALMPTGGGKSLTFQVPALAKEGICIVVTPLISLMKDQVGKLKKKGIKAAAVYSGMSRTEIIITMDNCLYGDYKFLYVSPERTRTELFRSRFEKMNVNLLAVDEAHCISQWGYDFRPSYLNIAEIREFHPQVPVLALTATATLDLLDDIQEKLGFREKNVLRISFERKNLAYRVAKSDEKLKQLVRMAQGIHGSGIIYVRSRKNARLIAEELQRYRISSTYYHAGLDYGQRDRRQKEWTEGKLRVIVATNAFGMGIDKPDVRFVLHYDIPDSIEAYFQEAGRAGRDGLDSEAVLLYNGRDRGKLDKRISSNFPGIPEIKRVYEALGNYFQLAVGAGKNQVFDFNIADFSYRFKFNMLVAYNSLKVLGREGYIELTEEVRNPSRIYFKIRRDDLYRFQVENSSFDGFIKLLLRSYTGLFNEFVPVSESFISRKGNIPGDRVENYLKKLQEMKVISYIPAKKTSFIVYSEERLDNRNLAISHESYAKRKEVFVSRQNRMWDYIEDKSACRSVFLLEYFGEKDALNCGKCDICTSGTAVQPDDLDVEAVKKDIAGSLQEGSLEMGDLLDRLDAGREEALKLIRFMLDNKELKQDEAGRICLS